MTMIGLSDRVIIAGGGFAAVRTAQALRELQRRGSIVMLSDEDLSYDRPPLSKTYLHGKAADQYIRLMTAGDLEELCVDVRLSQRVVGLDRVLRQVKLVSGEVTNYDRLVVATGARPVRLERFAPFRQRPRSAQHTSVERNLRGSPREFLTHSMALRRAEPVALEAS
jgi:NADPH-dependent 2,4-dienoyl-CoA reductase/sulfur reductase-like enzyme